MEQAFSANHPIRLALPVRKVNCIHWRDTKIAGGGVCVLGKYGGVPSYGLCTQHCNDIINVKPALHTKEVLQDEHQLLDDAIRDIPPFPGYEHQRGVVYCIGGQYSAMGWVSMALLMDFGFGYPIEVWHLQNEAIKASIFAPFGAKIRCAPFDDRRKLKSYAIANSAFKEVIYVDADNFPTKDLSLLFEAPPYASTGSLFWPDLEHGTDYTIWDFLSMQPTLEPEFAGGAMVVNRERCWDAINVAVHMNERVDFYHEYFTKDKDTYRFAWKLVDRQYSLIRHPPAISPARCILQYDHEDNVLFEHRAGEGLKWTLTSHHFDKMILRERISFLSSHFTQLWNGK